MKPAFKYAMCELARVAFIAIAFAKIWARRAGIMESPGISPASLLAGMCVRTVGPVVRARARAFSDFEFEDSEMVAGEGIEGGVVEMFAE